MKLSDMTTEKAFACMARMVPHVAEIVGDPAVAEAKRKLHDKAGELTNGDFMLAIYPLLMHDHCEAVCGIVAAMSEKTLEEVKARPYKKTLAAIMTGFAEDFFDFLPVAVRLAYSM